MVVVVWNDGKAHVTNLLAEVPTLKIATWALQVMPIFFAAGAISNRLSYTSARQRGDLWRAWLWHRVSRLLRPVAFYLAIWIPLVLFMAVAVPEAVNPLGKLATQLLWFLGVYLLVIATTPWQMRLATRGWPAIAGILAIVVLIDLGRFHVSTAISVANFLLVWFMAATLGLVMRDRVGRARAQFAWTAIAALVANVLLVAWFPYPLSMVGMPDEPISNMAPPTLVLALHAIVLISLIGLAWPGLERLCTRPQLWRGVVAAGLATMTVYLWHLTALVGMTVIEHGTGFDRGPVDGIGFWLKTPLHISLILVATIAIVSITAPFEHRAIAWFERALEPDARSDARDGSKCPAGTRRSEVCWSALTAAGVLVCGCGFLVLAATGMGGFPLERVTWYDELPLTPGLGFAFLITGALLARAGGRRAPTGLRVSAPEPTERTTSTTGQRLRARFW
jgi:hypothetical protein